MWAIHCYDKQNIAQAFGIERGITALVGGGGKTTLMYALADALSLKGRVVITTSTHIFPPRHIPLIQHPSANTLHSAFKRDPIVCVGLPDGNGKLVSSQLSADELLPFCDFVLVEADGAKGFPIKAPADHEPVIPIGTSHVIAVAGLDGISKSIMDAAFRFERYAQLIEKSVDDLILPIDVAKVLQHPLGQRKNVTESMRFSVCLNKADNSELHNIGDTVAEHMDPILVDRIVVASLKN